MIIHNMEQGSEEWFEIRKLKLTASHADVILVAGKGLDTYTTGLVSEAFSLEKKKYFSNADTERGNKLEPIARMTYELENNIDVKTVGFIEVSKYVGISPDGLIGDNGGLEIKCLNDENYIDLVLNNIIKKSHYAQMQMSMYCTGRKWWDYFVYNNNYRNTHYIKRIEPDEKTFKKIEKGIETGIAMLKEKITRMEKLHENN